jgi:hypothetical protein
VASMPTPNFLALTLSPLSPPPSPPTFGRRSMY